jgi:hypothetical protein
MKECFECKKDLCETEFYNRNSKKDKKIRLSHVCKSCFNSYIVEKGIQNKLWAVERMGKVCFDCKKSFHYAIFEFHHLDPSKKDVNWTKMKMRSRKISKKSWINALCFVQIVIVFVMLL